MNVIPVEGYLPTNMFKRIRDKELSKNIYFEMAKCLKTTK